MSAGKSTAGTDSSKSRGHWNMLLSGADPELHELADYLGKMIPGDSLLHSRIVRRLIGVLKAWAESKAEGFSPFVGALIEKATDVGDMITGDKEHEAAGRIEKPVMKMADDWVKKVFIDADERIKKAADPEAEAEKVVAEFTARIKVLEAIEAKMKEYEDRKKASEPEPPHHHDPPKFGEAFGSFVKNLKDAAKPHGYTERRKS